MEPLFVYLVGFMGAGKSSIGPRLAERLNVPFLDTDHLIEVRRQCTIADIFRREGETAFRAYERQTVADQAEPAVMALGGGAYIQQAVRLLIRERGRAVFLEWPLSVLKARVQGDPNRPLAQNPGHLKLLYQSRLPLYRSADIRWRAKPPYRQSVEEIVDDIAGRLAKLG